MRRAASALLGVMLAAGASVASTRYDPRLRFQTISTTRFDIHFHQGEEALAQRLARIVEDVATTIDGGLGPAGGRVQVILVDQNDLSNGWATPVPYNTIEITAAAPAADSTIGNTDDWLRLVFVHEYTHIVHLSRSGGWIGGLRRVFGRLPVLYPNTFTPIWQIEGIATWQESAQTGAGRVPAADFRLLLRKAAAERRLEPLDRASSRLVDWPSGSTPYLYGAYFHQFLADRYGPDSLRRLTDETSKRLPYFGALAYRKVFGRSLGGLWREFESSVSAADGDGSATRLTSHGFFVSGPRFIDGGRVLYSLEDPHAFPSLRELDLRTGRTRNVAARYLGEQVSVTGDRAIFDQIEVVHDVGLQSDLYSVQLGDGRVRRITFGSRALDPDVSPDGSTLAFVVQRADRRELATAPLAPDFRWTPKPLASAADQHFAAPRWSPDGKSIAAERRLRGGASEIVVVDAAGGGLRVLVAAGRNATPVWSPDGATIFFTTASDEHAFQIRSIPATGGSIQQLQNTGLSAQSPAISPDGRSLVFVGYTTTGYDLFQLSLDTARWGPVIDARATPPPDPESGTVTIPARSYSPAGTILPRFWTPTLESDEGETVVGAATGSFDALARHAYAVEGGWAASRARPDWQVAYAYDRWRPTFYLVASDDTDPWRGGERRTVEADAGMRLVSRRIRWEQTVLAELHGSSERFSCPAEGAACDEFSGLQVRRTSIRTGLSFDAARMFGYSISPEEGGRVTATFEGARSGSLGGLSSTSATVDARGYFGAWPRHGVLAVRGAAAVSWGDRALRRQFSAAGSDPQPGGFNFGTDAIGLIRGLDPDDVFGHRAAVVNIDYRIPIAHVERGLGTLPFFLRNIHAAAFVDAGNAWSDDFRNEDIRSSFGAELSVDAVLGYFLPITFSTGAAWRRGPDPDARGLVAFARLGRAF